jgi:hypothetical protein
MLRNLFIDWILPMLPASTYHVFIFSFEEYFGGDSGNVTDRLHGVAEIAASSGAFAAILQGSGRVVAWGAVDSGGASWSPQWTCLRKAHPLQMIFFRRCWKRRILQDLPLFSHCAVRFLATVFDLAQSVAVRSTLAPARRHHESSTGTGRCAANPSSLAVEDSQNWIKGL